jgi:hypothetical protein
MADVKDGAAIAADLALLLIAGLSGVGLLRLARVRLATRLEMWLLGQGIGLWLLAYVPLLLGAVHAFTPAVFRGVWIVAAVAAIGLSLAARGTGRASAPGSPGEAPEAGERIPGWCWPVAAMGLLFAAIVLFVTFTPIADYDGLAYHVAAPKRWLELGSMRFLVTQLHTQWPMGSEMLYALLLPVGGARAVKPFVALLSISTAIGTYAIGRRIAGRAAGIVAGACYLYALVPKNVTSTSVEPALTFAIVLAALALACRNDSEDARERRVMFVVAAAMAGFACCIKLNGLIPVFALAGFAAAVPPKRGARDWKRRALYGLCIAASGIVCALPWYVRSWINTGNPIFPFAYGIFGGRHWNAHATQVLSVYLRYFDVPGPTLAVREAFVNRELLKLAGVTIVALALPISRSIRAMIVAASVFGLAQIASSDQFRFLLPAAPFAALTIGVWMSRVAPRWPAIGWAGLILFVRFRLAGQLALFGFRHPALLALLALVALGLAFLVLSLVLRGWRAAANWPVNGWACGILMVCLELPVALGVLGVNYDAAVGKIPPSEFIQHTDRLYGACLWANANLPRDARVLCGPDSRIYHLQREAWFSCEFIQKDLSMDSPEAFDAAVRRAKIDYFIYNPGLFRWATATFEVRMGWRAQEAVRLEELAERCEPIQIVNGVTIYRVPR